MPYIARDVFKLDRPGLGLLVASFSGGALVGSLLVSALGGRMRPARVMLAACVVWYLCLVGFITTEHLVVAFAALFAAGLAQSLGMLALTLILLRTSEERFRGRIMGVRMLAIYTLPLGLLAAGATIPVLGFRPTALAMVGAGALMLVAITTVWRTDLLRREAGQPPLRSRSSAQIGAQVRRGPSAAGNQRST